MRHCPLFSPDVPSNPYSVRLSAVSQRLATVTFMKPDSHGGVPISYYLVQYKEVGSQDWRDVRSHSVQSESSRFCSSSSTSLAAPSGQTRQVSPPASGLCSACVHFLPHSKEGFSNVARCDQSQRSGCKVLKFTCAEPTLHIVTWNAGPPWAVSDFLTRRWSLTKSWKKSFSPNTRD